MWQNKISTVFAYHIGVKEAWVKDEEYVVNGEAAQEVEEEPGLHVLHLKKNLKKMKNEK